MSSRHNTQAKQSNQSRRQLYGVYRMWTLRDLVLSG